MKKKLLIPFVLIVSAFCYGQNQVNTISSKELKSYFDNHFSNEKPALKLIGIAKTNGIKEQRFGPLTYTIEYEMVIEAINAININLSVQAKAFDNHFEETLKYQKGANNGSLISGAYGNTTAVVKGQRFLAIGKVFFEQTDNGWRPRGFKNKTAKKVDKKFMTPAIIKQVEQERAIRVKKLKKELDWQKEDVPHTEVKPYYYQSLNVPVFKETITKYAITNGSFKGRNDVAFATKIAFYKGIKGSRRYLKSNQEKFTSHPNQSTAEFVIESVVFQFKELGYQCMIKLSAKVLGTLTSPEEFNYSYANAITAKSDGLKKNMNKEQALNSALKNLEKNTRKMVYSQNSIELEFNGVRQNKRGKLTHLLFKIPEPFVDASSLKFVVIKEGDLVVKNDKMSFNSIIGRCTYSGRKKEENIMCKVSGKKNKQAFLKLLEGNTQTKIIAVSTR